MSLEHDLERLRVEPPPGVKAAVLLDVELADGYVARRSALGPLFVAFSSRGVTMVDLAGDPDAFEARYAATVGRPPTRFDVPPDRIGRHLDEAISRGSPGRLSLDLRGLTPFQEAVLRRAATIPRGEVRPYGWIAREIGHPEAVRAVGSALARNPVPLIVPCHRVVRSDGSLGRYSLGADDNKARLLVTEGLDLAALRHLATRGLRFVGSTTTRIFCLPTCRAARRITPRHRREFPDADSAGDAGYRPCSLCRPG